MISALQTVFLTAFFSLLQLSLSHHVSELLLEEIVYLKQFGVVGFELFDVELDFWDEKGKGVHLFLREGWGFELLKDLGYVLLLFCAEFIEDGVAL